MSCTAADIAGCNDWDASSLGIGINAFTSWPIRVGVTLDSVCSCGNVKHGYRFLMTNRASFEFAVRVSAPWAIATYAAGENPCSKAPGESCVSIPSAILPVEVPIFVFTEEANPPIRNVVTSAGRCP
jgi:hypothetical protein